MRFQFSLSNDFYLLHLHLNNCDGNDMRSDVLVKQFRSFSKKPDFISPDLCPPNSPVDYKICGLMQERVYIILFVQQTPVCDISRCDQRFEPAPH